MNVHLLDDHMRPQLHVPSREPVRTYAPLSETRSCTSELSLGHHGPSTTPCWPSSSSSSSLKCRVSTHNHVLLLGKNTRPRNIHKSASSLLSPNTSFTSSFASSMENKPNKPQQQQSATRVCQGALLPVPEPRDYPSEAG